MIKYKYTLFIFLLSVSLIGCVNESKELPEKAIENSGSNNKTGSAADDFSKPESQKLESPNPSMKNGTYDFYDDAVKNEIELYFDKTAVELDEDDFKALSQLDYFVIGEPVKTLRDIPNLFPDIKYLNFIFDDFLSIEECNILKNLQKLKALSIQSRPADDLEFAKNLAYFEISYNENDCNKDKNNLASFSVLGKDFIIKNVKGTPLKYMCVKDNNNIYELVLTNEIEIGEFYRTQARTLFVSDITSAARRKYTMHCLADFFMAGAFTPGGTSGSVVCSEILDAEYMAGDYPDNRIFIEDVNFDGKQDILIDDGHFGNQMLVRYICFFNEDDGYKKCESFSEIGNPSIDSKNKKILSSWRNWAASHSWAMYTYDGTEYIMTDCLTEELIITEETDDSEEEVWQYIIEKQINGEMQETLAFTTKDYSSKEIHEIIYGDNSEWALSADKWNTLYNNGKMSDFSIYGNGSINEMILDIIEA